MKIIYIEQFFTLPSEAGITRHYDFAKALLAADNEVIVVTSCHSTQDRQEKIEGLEVHYLGVPYQNAFSFLQRLQAYFAFAIKAIRLVNQFVTIDFAYISSPPLTTGLVGLFLKKIKKIPYLFEVRDLWPQFPIEAGGIKNPFVKWAAYRFEAMIYANADKLIACSPGMEAGIRQKIGNTKTPLAMISNFSDTDLFFRREVSKIARSQYLAEEERGIVYFGAIGKANQVDYFVEMAEISQQIGIKLRFFVVGWGSEKQRLEEKARNLNNIHFLPPFAKSEMPFFLSLMDFSYTCFQDLPVLTTNSPNKLFDSLAMGLICFVNREGWMREMVEKNECGAYIPPTRPDIFIQKIQDYLQNPEILALHQQHARQVAENEFSKKVQVQKMLDFVI